jgi:membrane protein DedA with SNARE-associated domain
MSDLGEQIIAFLTGGQSAVGFAVLFTSAMVEYVFPPFPGDTVTLFGAFLAVNRGWNVSLVFTVVTLGSVTGAAIDYSVGLKLSKRPLEELSGRALKARKKVEPILDQFRRHGPIYVAVNRFLPGIRAFFFVAAGMARMPVKKVLFWGAVSAALWNILIIGAGFAIGKNWQRLLDLLRTYTALAWVAVGLVALFVVYKLIRR